MCHEIGLNFWGHSPNILDPQNFIPKFLGSKKFGEYALKIETDFDMNFIV